MDTDLQERPDLEVIDGEGLDEETEPVDPEEAEPAVYDFSAHVYEDPIPLDENVFADLHLDVDMASMDFDEWARLGLNLKRMDNCHQWWLGDWYLGGDDKWGEDISQVLDAFGASTIPGYARVSKRIPKSARRKDVIFSTHKEACGLNQGGIRAIKKALRLAAENLWTSREMTEYVKGENRKASGDDEPVDDDGDKEAGEASSVTFSLKFRVAPADQELAQRIADDQHDQLLVALAGADVTVLGDLGVQANVNESSE